MIPVLSQLLSDNETLLEYERSWNTLGTINFQQICRRLVARERLTSPQRPDMYYEGLYRIYLENYTSLDELIWKLPYDFSKEYFIRIGFNLYVKAEKFDDWMNLNTKIPPLLIIAASFVEDFYLQMLRSSKDIHSFVDRYLLNFRYTAQLRPYIPDLDYFIEEKKGLHDLHIHLNGSTETDLIWNYMLTHVYQTTHAFQANFNKSAVRKLSEQIIEDFTPVTLLKRLNNANELKKRMLVRVAKRIGISLPDKCNLIEVRNLWGDMSNQTFNGELLEELLFYIIILTQIRNDEDELLARWFHHYLLIKGLIHRFTVMQNMQKSFPQFQMLTENSFRYGIEEKYEQRFLQLSTCGQTPYLGTIEGRFSPKKSVLDNVNIVSSIIHGYEKARKKCDGLKLSQLALIAHFIKLPESEKDKKYFIRHRFLRKELFKKAVALCGFVRKSKYGKLIVGIDAAANEMDAGPEVFAPIYRYLRNNGIQHCTYHVGEDFRHLLSGLRCIWEAMEFLELRPGDRLGHCTALGIHPQLWYERIGDSCFVSQGEWLDDLVFAWEIVTECGCSNLQNIISRLESKISELSYVIYGKYYPPILLSKVWKLRKYNPFQIFEKDCNFLPWNIMDEELEISKVIDSFNDNDVKDLLYLYHVSTLHNSKCREKYDKIIRIKTKELLTFANLESIQNIILTMLAKRGIVIEALPSSNLRISYYNDLSEYHLSRWVRNSDAQTLLPPVVLGTDDPGIFMTNIYNEYARAYLHLESCGFSVSDRMNILSDIQRSSSVYKFNK